MNDSFSGKVVHTFPKNAHEEVWAYLQEYRGHQLAHVRVFTVDEQGDHPTRRGLALKVEDLPELVEAVAALCAAVQGQEGA